MRLYQNTSLFFEFLRKFFLDPNHLLLLLFSNLEIGKLLTLILVWRRMILLAKVGCIWKLSIWHNFEILCCWPRKYEIDFWKYIEEKNCIVSKKQTKNTLTQLNKITYHIGLKLRKKCNFEILHYLPQILI